MKLRIDGVIGWEVTARDVADALDGAGDVDLVINSGGGDILEGFSIYNAIKDHEGQVNISIDFAASMASVIAMAGDTVNMRSNSSLMMIHKPWSIEMGDAEDMRKTADTLDKMEGQLVGIYMERAGESITEDDLRDLLADETWLTAEEAVEYGLADAIQGGSKDAKINLGGVAFNLEKLAAKVAQKPIKGDIEKTESLSDIEGVLRDAAHLSRADATALVSRIKAVSRGDRGEETDTSELVSKFNSITAKVRTL